MAGSTSPELIELRSRLDSLLPPLLGTQRASWEQGHAAQALLECHHFFTAHAIPPPYDFLRYIYAFAHDAIVRQGPDGRLGVRLNGDGSSDQSAVDPACIGESMFFLVPHIAGETPSMQESVEKMLSFILHKCPRANMPENCEGVGTILSHRVDCKQIWSDTIYMLPPFLAAAAAFYFTNPPPKFELDHDPKRLMRMALHQIDLAAQVLQSPDGEWSHIYDLSTEQFQRKAFWGVGNGWAACGIIRIFGILLRTPKIGQLFTGDEGMLALLLRSYEILMQTIKGCMKHLCADGLFHDILNDPTSFVETNLAQQLAHVLFRLLDFHIYIGVPQYMVLLRPTVEDLRQWETCAHTMREAAVQKTDRWGFVRDVCGSPSFDKLGTAAEGQAWGVLMEVARTEYLTHKREKEQAI